MLRADVRVIEGFGFLACEGEDLLHAGRVRDAALGLGFLTGADLLFDGVAHGFEIKAHLLKDADGDALAELDQSQEDVLGADVIVVKAVGFLAGQRQHLLGAGGEIVHRFHRACIIMG